MFDDAIRKLEGLTRRLENLHGEHRLPFEEVFPDEFMLRNTDHPSISAMIQANGFSVQSSADFDSIPEDVWNQIVHEQTRFENWDAMKQAAAREWAMRQLDLD